MIGLIEWMEIITGWMDEKYIFYLDKSIKAWARQRNQMMRILALIEKWVMYRAQY